MDKKGAPAAVIEIGSSVVRMRVSQLRQGQIDILDTLEYPVYFGHEVFNDGKLSFESLRQLSVILSKFTSALQDYGCKNVRVVSSTVMREASNRSFVADQIKIHNGLDLEILEYSTEKALICSEIIRILSQDSSVDLKDVLIAYVGTGSIGVALYDGHAVSLSQNIPVGSLKLHDELGELNEDGDGYYSVVEEYLDIVFDRVDIPTDEIRGVILTGSDLDLVASACKADKRGDLYTVSTAKLRDVYSQVRAMSYSAVARRFGISEDRAEILYTALSIYTGMLRLCRDQTKIICPDIDICDAVTRHMLVPDAEREYRDMTWRSALVSAGRMAGKYNCNSAHSAAVSKFATALFDKMKKTHGLPDDRKLYLQLASALHSCGQYVNVRTRSQCSFDMIKNFDIFGLTGRQLLTTAFIAGYGDPDSASSAAGEYYRLSEKKRLEIAKLAAVFRLANSLDKSKRQKLTLSKLKITEDKLIIKADSSGSAMLEKWAFDECAGLFKDVFGLSPELHVRLKLL